MKSIIVAGNGPSVKDIDYRRLPKQIDTLRVNHFYKEEYFYLTKNVTYYLPAGRGETLEYIPLVFAKTIEGVYNIHKYILDNPFITEYFSYLTEFFESKIVNEDLSKMIWNYVKLYNNYHNSNFYLNSGTVAIVKAIECGYTDIYIVGIELQDADNWTHFYARPDNQKYEINAHKKHHMLKFDKDLIRYMSNLPGINMYSISESSGINSILELAPIQNDDPYIPVKKSKQDMELSEDSLLFLKEVKEKIMKELPKSKIFFYKKLEMPIDEYEKEFARLENEERLEAERLENEKRLEVERLENEKRLEAERLEKERLEAEKAKKKLILFGIETTLNYIIIYILGLKLSFKKGERK